MSGYLVVFEKGETNWGAWVPDLPGCVAVGDTLEETKSNIKGAIDLHLRGMAEDHLPIPEPTSTAEVVNVG